MSRTTRFAALSLVLAPMLAACDDDEDVDRFVATLSGQNENPARTTPASGTAEFEVRGDNSIVFTLDATNIRNVTAAHIHGPAPTTGNAGVIVDLFIPAGATGAVNGRLASGTLTSTNAGNAVDLDSLLVLMSNGNAYVNVHTNDGVAPTNTGPGDFPGGEIRGQILRR